MEDFIDNKTLTMVGVQSRRAGVLVVTRLCVLLISISLVILCWYVVVLLFVFVIFVSSHDVRKGVIRLPCPCNEYGFTQNVLSLVVVVYYSCYAFEVSELSFFVSSV